MITGTAPPSTDHAAPVTLLARAEHRKTITSAISPGSAKRPSGIFSARRGDRLLGARPRPAICSPSPPGAGPQLGGHRTRRHRVDQHVLGRPAVGERARERQLRGLGHRVGDVALPGPLARRRRDVDDPPAAARGHPRRRLAASAGTAPARGAATAASNSASSRSSSATERDVPGVVDEHVDAAHLLGARRDDPLGRRRASVTSMARNSPPQPSGRLLERVVRRAPTNSTCAPSSHSRRAVSRPMPRLAPVTTQTLSVEPQVHLGREPTRRSAAPRARPAPRSRRRTARRARAAAAAGRGRRGRASRRRSGATSS